MTLLAFTNQEMMCLLDWLIRNYFWIIYNTSSQVEKKGKGKKDKAAEKAQAKAEAAAEAI